MAAQVMPQFTGLIDELNKIDLTGIGESLGDGIAVALELLERTLKMMKPAIKASEKLTQTQSTYGGQAFMGMGGMGGAGTALSAAVAAADEPQPTTSIFDQIRQDIEKKRSEARKKYATPDPGESGAGYIPKAGGGGPIGMPDISSLQKVGGGSGLLFGGQDNSPAYQSVRIQEDIRDYIKDLIQTVKDGGQSYQISPNTSSGMVLIA
jgi:hypothetical protein